MTLALGLMSGTSCDGVSAALVEFRGRTFRVRAHRTDPYTPVLRRMLLERARHLHVPGVAQLNMLFGELFADSALRLLKSSRASPSRVSVIGSHGHTFYHGPSDSVPCTLQLGEPAVIAERTRIPVVSNFRMRDMAAGGQGAPLIPYFDHYFFGQGPPRALQNIGGIANVTLVGKRVQPVAFDTGPGNGLLDAAARLMSKGKLAYDPDGRHAARGRVNLDAVGRMLQHPYFRQAPPKSTGPELFNTQFLDEQLGRRWRRAKMEDTLATLTFFTAVSIAHSYRRFLPAAPASVIVSGGGAKNRTLLACLRALLAPVRVESIERYGLPPEVKEPAAFAFFALQALRGRINHLPGATGASRACILGTITPA